ncbi:Uncharacterized protein conserved in bacteria [Anaerococcus prevotii]|uniref:DUF4015 domain-containing protein n=1 Tax=Anaerococcus prevotii (strain ATCC 9321 / DSM 20548 / JCM 6508 / NCTC 11806 / PC1) TaxID=525919 RepID=C7RDA2_ANAPD|nr:putative glycoside hydrolase [Anaerococcus prevotii]ACV29165.1 conserved hypothetical protein [Anaerococcus prevotii DSM 20548]SUU94839.1 Uncharacterized protein conserved in bacteria [Anaerococcus prevotii]
MKNKKLIISFLMTLVLIFTACSKETSKSTEPSENKKSEESIENRDDSKEKDDKANNKGLVNEAVDKEIGVPYEVGVTPDDYNMDYDTSRLHSLKDKKSKYYPKDGVKGLYFNTYSINNPEVYDKIMDMLENTRLNSIVVDIKDDWGNVTMDFDTDDPDIEYASIDIINPKEFIKEMHDKGIYVIGRVTTFKDSIITEKHPDRGFTLDDGSLWKNGHGEAFMNPFLKEVQDYDIKIAKLAAEAGFDEIQFDYVRFAEGFENFGDTLDYPRGEFEDKNMEEGDKRVAAITGFVQRAREELQDKKVPISIDVFGYALQVERAGGIGQDFGEMSNQTDVISSMIYPSHWGFNSFDIEKPDLEPYELVKRYLKAEQEYLSKLDHPPLSRPWIQDFTASWIGDGNWMEYDKDAVEAQIKAIYDSGQEEFLIWNASSEYTQGVEY